MHLGTGKLKHIQTCKMCNGRVKAVLSGDSPAKAIKLFHEPKVRFWVYFKKHLISKRFKTHIEAETFIGIESTQMEYAEGTRADWEIEEVRE